MVSLAGALRSPFFCLSDDGLFWLATSFRRDLAANLHRCDQIHELSPTDGPRARRAARLLDELAGIQGSDADRRSRRSRPRRVGL